MNVTKILLSILGLTTITANTIVLSVNISESSAADEELEQLFKGILPTEYEKTYHGTSEIYHWDPFENDEWQALLAREQKEAYERERRKELEEAKLALRAAELKIKELKAEKSKAEKLNPKLTVKKAEKEKLQRPAKKRKLEPEAKLKICSPTRKEEMLQKLEEYNRKHPNNTMTLAQIKEEQRRANLNARGDRAKRLYREEQKEIEKERDKRLKLESAG